MPLIPTSTYQRPWLYFNSHIETIWPSMFRKVKSANYQRERLELVDGDFLDLDWITNRHKKLVIISHGLEGNSHRHYSMGMAKYFSQRSWDALAWNCRSCSGEMNRLPRFYHHGATEDITAVVNHAIEKGYETIAIVGFSMGGSMTLKYFGENANRLHSSVQAAAVFSVPCNLASSARQLDQPSKSFYRNRFLKKLKKKIQAKERMFPGKISAHHFETIRSFEEFDHAYTCPLHGFSNAAEFYSRASSGQFIPGITRPTLIVNAANDPFLPSECFPVAMAKESASVFLEIPAHGGHVGFSLVGREENWMEIRAFEFISAASS